MASDEARYGVSRDGLVEFEARVASIPRVLHENANTTIAPLAFHPRGVRRILVTGIGSSAGHAHFLASVLSQELGLPAQFVSTGSLAAEPPGSHASDVLIVFSQGLSPNARFALFTVGDWVERILVTGIGQGGTWMRGDESSEREAFLAEVQAAGVRVIPMSVPEESGMLVRVMGPMAGYQVALKLKEVIAEQAGFGTPARVPGVDRVCRGIAAAEELLEEQLGDGPPLAEILGSGLVLLASGGYGSAVQNLGTKILEGMGLVLPPFWDLLEFAHGGFQQFFLGPGTAIALTRTGALRETEWMSRVQEMLDPTLHRWLELPARLEWPYSVFEHEAYFNGLLVRWLKESGRDPREWPARGLDGPLYDLAPATSEAAPVAVVTARPRAFEPMSWPELESFAATVDSLAVIALGSTEQHGPHLPLATDTWIANALAEGFCEHVPEAIRLPALPLGCAEEHLEFPGTLSLQPESLERVLCDVIASLEPQGFERVFVFSAHGGNMGALRAMRSTLSDAAGRMQLIVFDRWEALTAEIHRLAEEEGVSAEAAGHHAGEAETSMLRWIAPAAVRRNRIEPGLRVSTHGADDIFYPSLRNYSANGVVGDALEADAARGSRYLDCWIQMLVRYYREQIELG